MSRIPNKVVIAVVASGLLLAVALGASVSSVPTGFARTDVKIEAKDTNVTTIPAATLRSLAPAHAAEIHSYVETPDTEDTHSLRVESK